MGIFGKRNLNTVKANESIASKGVFSARRTPEHEGYAIYSNPEERGGANYGRCIGYARDAREAERKVGQLAKKDRRR